jgi:hypothetical protein
LTSQDKLKKAYILPHDQNGKEINDPVQVLFNPEQYSVDKSNQFANMAVPGRDSPVIQFVRGESETLTVDLFFDTYTYNNGEDVRRYTDKVSNLLKIKGEIHAPPVCSFHWGPFVFTGIIEKVGKKFTMFKEDGTPVRATLSVSFKQYASVDEPRSSPDKTKTRVIKQGDSLWLMAALEYGDPSKWKEIADANPKIENPRFLKPGIEITIPPLKRND